MCHPYIFSLELAALKGSKHRLHKHTFIVEAVAYKDKDTTDADCNDRTIEVSGFGRMSVEQLEMYFESPKAGSRREAIKNCAVFSKEIFHITFYDRRGTYIRMIPLGGHGERANAKKNSVTAFIALSATIHNLSLLNSQY